MTAAASPPAVILAVLASLAACSIPPVQDPQAAGDREALAAMALTRDDTIVTRSARTVDFNGQALVPRYVHMEREKAGTELRVDQAVTRVVLGLDRDLTLSLAIPWVNKRLRGPGMALGADGFADVPVVAKYRFFQETGAGETTEAAALFGLELPVGATDLRQGGTRLPQPMQLGSGSLDAIAGAAFTRVDGRFLLNADLIARLHSEADDFRFGNVYRFDVGGHFRIYPERFVSFDQISVNLVAEINTVYAGRNSAQGIAVADSGGLRVLGTPGIQCTFSDRLLLEAAVQLPLLQELHGNELEDRYTLIVGLRARF